MKTKLTKVELLEITKSFKGLLEMYEHLQDRPLREHNERDWIDDVIKILEEWDETE